MAANLAAEAFLSVMFEKLFEKLASLKLMNFFKGKKSIDDQLKDLDSKLRLASRLLNDAEEKQISDPDVKKWMDDLKDVIYRAQDLVEEIEDEARSKQERESGSEIRLLKKLKSIFPSSSTQFDLTVQGEMTKIFEDLNLVLDNRVARGLKEDDGKRTTSSQSLIAPWREESRVHGRAVDKQKILKLLLSNHAIWGNKIGVLPIVGMGGLGKTTLAQLLYDDSSFEERDFQLKAWVSVSTEFDFFQIMKLILEQINPQLTRDIKEATELQHELKKALKGKKFFFILDDIWEENYKNWDLLKSTLEFGEHESKIIVTTRSEKVATVVASTNEIYKLLEVSFDDCWKIFVDHAFHGDSNVYPELQDIGKEIVEKCKGNPLAVISLGGLLRTERDPKKWENILRSRVWDGNENWSHNILPSLWLSYRYLPSSCLKQCFAYCSIFPKDYEIEKEKIILLWMAEGFLQLDHHEGKRIEEVGEEYFDALISRSLFQRSSQGKSIVVMHDLVHDLAMFVSGEFCLTYNEKKNLKHFTSKIRHISHYSLINNDLMKSILEAKHVRTFIQLTYSSYSSLDDEFLKELLTTRRFLRVLSSSMESISRLPDSFGNYVKHLRYLDLSNSEIQEIPTSICALYYLQTLLLSKCKNLTRLPIDLERLINLRHLDTIGTPLEEMPPHMGKLKELQTLSDFVLGKSKGSSIKELGELQNVSGKLRISKLQNVENVEDVRKANLMRHKDKLKKLVLEWEGDAIDIQKEMEVFDALEPNKNLMKLTVRGYKGFTFPNWVGDSSFSNIISMNLSDNEYCQSLPPLGQLPALQKLVIKDFREVETIDEDFYRKNSSFTPFQSLKTLMFCNMPKWRQWSFSGHEEKGGYFPHLIKLSLDFCPFIESLPLDQFTKLKELSLSNCQNLKQLTVDILNVVLETLKLERCNKLESLPLDQFKKLKELNLSKCENLKDLIVNVSNVVETLEIEECSKLESLPLDLFRKLNKLTLLKCENLKEVNVNFADAIKTLKIEECHKLNFLESHHYEFVKELTIVRSCDYLEFLPLDYFPRLESLVLGECENLKSLNTAVHQSLSYWRLEDCKNFMSLPEHMSKRLQSLSYLGIFNCPKIESFPQGGLPSNLRKLVIVNCCKLVAQHRHWDLQGLTSLEELIVSECDMPLDSFPEGSLPVSLTSFQIRRFPWLESLNGNAFQHLVSFEELNLSECNELKSLPEQVLPTSLRKLHICNCPFLERRYHKDKGDEWHKISHIPKVFIWGKTTHEED